MTAIMMQKTLKQTNDQSSLAQLSGYNFDYVKAICANIRCMPQTNNNNVGFSKYNLLQPGIFPNTMT